jgi:hypothetical protein
MDSRVFDQPPDGIWKPAPPRIWIARPNLAQRYGEASLRNTGGVCGTTIRDPDGMIGIIIVPCRHRLIGDL